MKRKDKTRNEKKRKEKEKRRRKEKAAAVHCDMCLRMNWSLLMAPGVLPEFCLLSPALRFMAL